MFCSFHKGRIAVSACAKCGKGVCAECQAIIQGQYWCRSCAASHVPIFYSKLNSRNPWVAAIASLIIPGMGQAYNGQVMKGIIIFLSFWLVIPWVYGVVDAFISARAINSGRISSTPHVGCLIGCLGMVFLLVTSPLVFMKTIQYYTLISQMDAQEGLAIGTLRKISEASESYAKVHGVYPEKYSQLYFADPPYLDDLYCDVTLGGGKYNCVFSKKGYLVTFKPEPSSLLKKTFSISTGGILVPFEQKNVLGEIKPEDKTGTQK